MEILVYVLLSIVGFIWGYSLGKFLVNFIVKKKNKISENYKFENCKNKISENDVDVLLSITCMELKDYVELNQQEDGRWEISSSKYRIMADTPMKACEEILKRSKDEKLT